jgi:predicted Zn-dependent protease
MNLLGHLYLQEGEGDDIALSLCRKSVELERANLGYRLNLAEAQLRCRMIPEARENLLRCLRSRKLKCRAQLLLGRSYSLEGRHARAKRWFARLLAQEQAPSALRDQALALARLSAEDRQK